MKIEAKTSTRRVKYVDRFGVVGDRIIPVAELWVDGVCLVHECASNEEARAMTIRLAYAFGVER